VNVLVVERCYESAIQTVGNLMGGDVPLVFHLFDLSAQVICAGVISD